MTNYNSSNIKTLEFDALIIGGGGSGMRAQKENGLALLLAPKSTEVKCPWTKEFPEVSQALKEQGFNPSQWFVPTKEQLRLAYQNIPNEFSATDYWSSTEFSANVTHAYFVYYNNGCTYCNKANPLRVRAFRCVTY